MNKIKYYDKPWLFYFLATAITWTAWFIAAHLSHTYSLNNVHEKLIIALMLIGLVSPAVTAFSMMYLNKNLRNDLASRLFHLPKVRPIYLLLSCGLMAFSIILAQGISLFFGYSIEQFSLARGPSFTLPLVSAWVPLLLAPALEELAWHSYGTDCLRARFNLFTTCLLFAAFWVIWHVPLFYIKGYYQSNIAHGSWIYALNFAVSVFVFVFLMNWLYYKTNRNILLTVIFHTTAGVFNEIFATHPDSKIIQTILLAVLAFVITYKERDMFFKSKIPSST